jgi:hypothetical protein
MMLSLALALAIANPSADHALVDARAKYDAVAYDQALAILESALASPSLTNDDKARLLAFAALVKTQMADDAGAQKSVDQALALDACVPFPDAAAPPALKQKFAAARAARIGPATSASSSTVAAQSSTAASEPTTSTPTSPGNALVPAGIAAGVAGVVALAGGGVLAALALASHGQAASAKFQSDVLADDDSARQQIFGANALFAAGAGLVVAGVAVAAVGAALE